MLLLGAAPQLAVSRGTPPPLDPNADSSAWKSAPSVTLPWDVQGGHAMREQTIAYVATSGTALYVRFDATQREPIFQTQRTNDVGQGTDDEVWVDLWPTGPTGFQYQFFVTPNGTHYASSSENTAFSPRWDSHGAMHGAGYTVTMRIPLGVMRGAQSSHDWRVQFVRYIRATGAQAVWSYDAAQINPDDPARAGAMKLDVAVAHRRLPRIGPYLLTGTNSRAGLDLSIPLNASNSFYATLHPDFSNVELDQQTIAPTVFPRAYAEVRPFFAQGANNFNQFYCNFCNSLTPLYTPAIPTPRDGYALEGKTGPFSYTAFDAVGIGRDDRAAGVVYASPDTRWNASINRVEVDQPGFFDDVTVAGAYYNDLKHVVVYANYGNDAGTGVVQGNRAQYYDTGATWSSQTFSIWGGVHRIGSSFNPADGYVPIPGVSGWGVFANKIWTTTPNDAVAAFALGGELRRNHGDDGPLDQTDNRLNFDVLTRSAIDLNVSTGSTYIRFPNDLFEPVSQNGASLTFHSGSQTNNPTAFNVHGPSATPTTFSYTTGRFGEGRLDTWVRTSTIRIASRGMLTLDVDDTTQYFAGAPANVQWFERVGYTHQLSADSSLGIGVRRVVGQPPQPNGGGNCIGTCSNISFAYHARFHGAELYAAYGDPNALTTVPQVIIKAIFYVLGEKGT